MNHGQEDNTVPAVEQSWIVLDDHGWAGSRPATASPSRPFAKATPFEEDGDDEETTTRRLGMDRDVREALELAERSLELAGSAEEFMPHHSTRSPSEEDTSQRSSPLTYRATRNFGHTPTLPEDSSEIDKYNGRAPPLVKRTLAITTDSEHMAFQNIKLVGNSTAEEEQSKIVPKVAMEHSSRTETPQPLDTRFGVKINNYDQSIGEYDKGEDEGILQWMFGIQPNANVLPLVLTHMVTFAAGLYLGMRRVSLNSASVSPPTTVTGISGVSQQA